MKSFYLEFKFHILVIVSFVLLFLSFGFNIFGLGEPGFFQAYQKDSETLVTNQLQCYYAHGKDIFGGMLVNGSSTINDCSTKNNSPYTSQFNLEGKIVTFFAPSNKNVINEYIGFVRIIFLSLLILSLVWLIVGVAIEFSFFVSYFLLGFLLISNWLVYISRNLYWIPVLLFLPFVVSFNLYPKFKQQNRLWFFYTLLGVLFFLKCLAGYEYITCLILSACTPVIYWEVKQLGKVNLRKLFKPLFFVGTVGVIGFFCAVAMHVAQLSFFYHSFSRGLETVKNRAFERTVGEPGEDILVNLVTQTKYIEHDLYYFMNSYFYLPNLSKHSPFFFEEAVIYQTIVFLFLGLYSLPIVLKAPISWVVQSVAFTLFVSALILIFWGKKKLLKVSAKHLAISFSLAFSFLSSLSWIILAHPHAIHHLHLTGIVYYMPYALVFYVFLGVFIEEVIIKKIT